MNTMKDLGKKETAMTTANMRSNDVYLIQQHHHPKTEEQAANHQHYRVRRQLDVLEKDWNEDQNGATNEDKGWQGNHQGATNSLDPSDDPGLLYEGDYPVEYSCSEMIDTVSDPTGTTTLSFYYEATLPKSQDVQSNVEALEWSLLEAAAKRTGLSPKCNLSMQYDNVDYDPGDVDANADADTDGSGGNRDRYKRLLKGGGGSEDGSNQKESSMSHQQQKRRLDSSLAYPVAVYSINRHPSDTISDGCAVLDYDPEVEQCVTIKSNMKVQFRGQFEGSIDLDRVDVEAYLKEIFNKGMDENPKSMRVGYIENLAYVGDKDDSAVAIESSNTISASPSSNDGGALLPVVLVGMSTVVVLGIFVLLLRKRRRGDSAEDDEKDVTSPKDVQVITEEESISVLPDLECGSTQSISVTSSSSRHHRSKSEGALLHVHTGDMSIVAKDIMADTTYSRSRDDDDSDDCLPSYQIPVLMRSNSDPTADQRGQRQRQHVQGHVTPPTLPIPGDAGDSPKPPVQEVPMLIRTSNLMIPNLPPELQNIDMGLPFADSQESPDSSRGGCSDGGIASTNAVILASASSGSTPSSGRSSGELPPRPPLRRKNSINLKKKRKKRKKKKKVTLARVNSRENINEMSMIAEEDENENANTDVEGDGTGTEGTPTDGSECTWESGSTGTSDNSIDDGSSNQSSSSCGTPIRNHTTTPTQSRNNSPSNTSSSQDGLFPSDIFSSDFEFLIEAPDFPYGKGKIKNRKDDGNNLNMQPRLTSKPSPPPQPSEDDDIGISPKERKIPKLPAPWV